MIKVLEEQDLEIIYGEEISDEEKILYEISSNKESLYEELIFMMTNNSQAISQEADNISQEELQAIRLGDVIGEEKTFTDEELAKFEKMQEVAVPEIYKLSKFNFFSARVFEQYSGNTQVKWSEEGNIDISFFDKKKVAIWKKKNPEIQ